MTKEHEIKEKIFNLVSEYYNNFHKKNNLYKPGDRISYAGRVFNEDEMINLVDSALEFWLTSGKYTDIFERKLSEFLGINFCSFVNSGSSANLCAFMALTSPLLNKRRILRGDEVITVAAGFPTTIAPIIQYGAVPVFIDVTIPEYNIDVSKLDKALSKKTKAVIIAHTLGNPFDLSVVKEFCNKNNLWLIEDNCDALGAKYIINGDEYYTGTVGDIGTSSFYPAHHITTGEGGAVYTNNPLLNKIIRSMRDWGRDCMCPSGKDNFCGHRFNKQYGNLPFGYDHKYVYSHFGYNLKASDMQAAIGVAQLKKLPDFIKKRQENFNKLYKGLSDLKDKFILPEKQKDSIPSWFGFPLTCRENINRNIIIEYLEKNNIQTRLLFSGNIIKHPCFDYLMNTKNSYRIVDELTNTDKIMNNTFWIGLYPGMTNEKINYMIQKIHEAV